MERTGILVKRGRAVAVATLTVLAGLTIGGPPAAADHGGDHPKRSFFVDVHLATPAIAPIANVCVDEDGEDKTPATCTPSSIASLTLADYRVAVDIVARTAAPPKVEELACDETEPRGAGLRVSALGTGIDNARVTVTDLATKQVVFKQDTGKVLGNRVALTAKVCSE